MKKLLVCTWLAMLLIAACALFWYNDLIYQLPTPVPPGYKPVANGTVIPIKGSLAAAHDKPVFLHFYNPSCPCSRFNAPHFRSLVQQFGRQADFAVVVLNANGVTAQQIQQKLGVEIPVLFDSSLAAACGVYSTPQAVLLDSAHRLYYRGNYNRGRYCTDEKTSYAKIALEGLLQGFDRPFSPIALKAYGCQLITCKKIQ